MTTTAGRVVTSAGIGAGVWDGLTTRYGGTVAVDGLNLVVPEGIVYRIPRAQSVIFSQEARVMMPGRPSLPNSQGGDGTPKPLWAAVGAMVVGYHHGPPPE